MPPSLHRGGIIWLLKPKGSIVRSSLKCIPPRTCDCRPVSHDKKLALILRIDLSVGTEGRRSVSRPKGLLLKDLLLKCPSLINCVHVAVFTVGVDDSVSVYHRCIDAPLETV